MIPDVTSAVVGVLMDWITSSPSSSTASVFVPPTSIPIRRRSAFAGLRRSTVGLSTGIVYSALRRSTAGLSTGIVYSALRRSTVGLSTGIVYSALRRSTVGLSMGIEDTRELEVVAEGAGADVLQALGSEEDRRGGERDD